MFRDAGMRIVDAAHSAPLVYVMRRHADVERIDLWPRGRRECTAGFAFTDGTTGIGEIPWNAEAVEAWAQARGLGKKVRIHLTRKKD